MNNLDLKQKGLILSVSFSILVVICSIVVFSSLSQSKSDTAVVNAAGTQRMLSQAMGKSILGYALAENDLQAAEKQVREIDKYITQMRGVYTANVIGAAKAVGLSISMHPSEEPDPAVPFPATFARIIGEKFSTNGDLSVDIIAKEPVNPIMGLRDQIDQIGRAHV